MQSIHCKVSLASEFRRFLFPCATFNVASLQTQIRYLYGIVGEFVLKYKDDEGDLITVERDEELKCAVAESAGLLRLFVEVKNEKLTESTETMTDVTLSETTTPVYGRCGRGRSGPRHCHQNGYGHHGRGRHGHGEGPSPHGHPRCHGQWNHGKHSKAGKHGCRGKSLEQLTAKRDLLAAVLMDVDVACNEHKREKLQRKLQCIERRLSAIQSGEVTPGNDKETSSGESWSSDEKWRKKKSDKWNRKYHGKRTTKNMSEETLKQIALLKSQIWEMKPSLNAVKIQLCEKKCLLAEAKSIGNAQRVEELKKELDQLKEIKKEHRKTIAPLKQRIRALKFDEY